MEISLRTTDTRAEIKIETGNAIFSEDLAGYSTQQKGWYVEDSTIEKFVTIANDLSRFNGNSDLSFVEKIVSAFLNDTEKLTLIDHIQDGN